MTNTPTQDNPSPAPDAPPEDEAACVVAEPEDEDVSVIAEPEDEGVSVIAEPEDGAAGETGRPRRRRLLVMAVALVVVLVAASGAVAWWALNPDPRDVAKDYFTRLAAGDANGALRAIDKRSIGADLPTSDPLLTDAALSDPASRPQAMTITHVVQSGDTATMTVLYQANGSTVTQTLKAQRRGREFVLESPLVRLSFANLAAADKARVTVNGIAVDPAKPGSAFPGAYAVTADGNALFTGRSATAVPSPNATATVTLPPPSLSAEGRAKADAAIAAALQQCATNLFRQRPACPEVNIFQPGNFTSNAPLTTSLPVGTIVTTGTADIAVNVTRLPVCTYTPDADSVDHVTFSSVDGVVHWRLNVTLANGTPVAGSSGDTSIAPRGRVSIDANDQLQVAFT